MARLLETEEDDLKSEVLHSLPPDQACPKCNSRKNVKIRSQALLHKKSAQPYEVEYRCYRCGKSWIARHHSYIESAHEVANVVLENEDDLKSEVLHSLPPENACPKCKSDKNVRIVGQGYDPHKSSTRPDTLIYRCYTCNKQWNGRHYSDIPSTESLAQQVVLALLENDEEVKSEIQHGIAQLYTLATASRSNEVYRLLQSVGVGPFDGGCLMLAKALQRVIGGELLTVFGRYMPPWAEGEIPQHVTVSTGNRFIDAIGVNTYEEYRKKWIEKERVEITGYAPYKQGDLPEAPDNPDIVDKLEKYLRSTLTP